MFNLRPFSEKIENYEIYIFVPNSKKSLIRQISHIKYRIINDPNIRQTIHQWWIDINANAKSQLHILGTDHQLFGKQSKKVARFYTEKSDDCQNT